MSATATASLGSAQVATDLTLSDPIRASQHVFRITLDALSNPGTLRSLIVHPRVSASETNSDPFLASLLVTLVDHEVSIHFSDHVHFGDLADLLVRRTRTALSLAEDATFAVAHGSSMDPTFPERLQRGSLAFPDDGATLIVAVESFDEADAAGLKLGLTGPGVESERHLNVSGLSAETIASRNRATSNYPTGIDLMLIDGDGRLVGIPRTTQITIAHEGAR